MECRVNIYISNISRQTTEDGLRRAFEGYGKVSVVNIPTDRDSGQPRGFAFVEMPAKHEATMAIGALNGRRLNGRALSVYEADQLEENGNCLAGNRSRKVY
jgi:RNA recognition motif-containing protein